MSADKGFDICWSCGRSCRIMGVCRTCNGSELAELADELDWPVAELYASLIVEAMTKVLEDAQPRRRACGGRQEQSLGCTLLREFALESEANKTAVVDAQGPAAVVAAMMQFTADPTSDISASAVP